MNITQQVMITKWHENEWSYAQHASELKLHNRDKKIFSEERCFHYHVFIILKICLKRFKFMIYKPSKTSQAFVNLVPTWACYCLFVLFEQS